MKRVVLLLVLLAGLCTLAQAADLQAGWYAQFEYVAMAYNFYIPGGGWSAWGAEWNPTSALTTTDILTVGQGSHPFTRGRTVTVNQPVTTIGTIFEDKGTYTTSVAEFNEIVFNWSTNYDASQMRLMLYVLRDSQPDKLIWSQTTTGSALGTADIRVYDDNIMANGDVLAFRVVAVPEASALPTSCALCCMLLAAYNARRRR